MNDAAELTARSQEVWAASIGDTEPEQRRKLAAAVGITTRMLCRYLRGSSRVPDGLARRIAEAAGLAVVPVTHTGFVIMKSSAPDDDVPPPPSRLGATTGLTGNRSTEVAIEALAQACADHDAWRPVGLHELDSVADPDVVFGPNVPFDNDRATARIIEIHQSIYGSDSPVPATQLSRPREHLADQTVMGRAATELVRSGWAEWADVGGWLGIEMTPLGLHRIALHQSKGGLPVTTTIIDDDPHSSQ